MSKMMSRKEIRSKSRSKIRIIARWVEK